MEKILNFIQGISPESIINPIIRIAVLLFTVWILTLLIKISLQRIERRLHKRNLLEGEPPSESQKRMETLFRLLRQAIYLVLWTVFALILLKELGVEIGPLLASAGIIGVALGFGAQNLVRDLIAGFFIILENQIRVGDVALINGTGGLVEEINIRTTVLRDLKGTVHIFPNGMINTLANLTNEWAARIFDIGVAYKEDTDRVVSIMGDVGRDLINDDYYKRLILEPIEIFGVDKFGESGVIIKGRIKTKPIRQWEVGREYLRRIKHAFDESGIEIPVPHRKFYFGAEEDSDAELVHKLSERR